VIRSGEMVLSTNVNKNPTPVYERAAEALVSANQPLPECTLYSTKQGMVKVAVVMWR
jgi:hypothetical protein